MYHVPATYTLMWNIYRFSTEWLIKSLKQLNNSALSTATATNKSQSLSLFYFQIQTLEDLDLWSIWVVKCHIFDHYASPKCFL